MIFNFSRNESWGAETLALYAHEFIDPPVPFSGLVWKFVTEWPPAYMPQPKPDGSVALDKPAIVAARDRLASESAPPEQLLFVDGYDAVNE